MTRPAHTDGGATLGTYCLWVGAAIGLEFLVGLSWVVLA